MRVFSPKLQSDDRRGQGHRTVVCDIRARAEAVQVLPARGEAGDESVIRAVEVTVQSAA